jgi:hypothetical protein
MNVSLPKELAPNLGVRVAFIHRAAEKGPFSETQGIRRAGAVRPRPSKVRFAYTGIASANLAVLRLAHSLQVLADHLQGALKLLLGAELDGLAVL